MSCEEIRRQLDDYVDDALTGEARRRVVAHLEECAACAGIATDVIRIRDTARALGPIAPPERVWQALADRVRLESANPGPEGLRQGYGESAEALAKAEGPGLHVSRPPAPVSSRRVFVYWAGLAAALLIVTAAIFMGISRSRRAAPDETRAGAGNAGAAHSVKAIEEELLEADRLYSDAIAKLEAIADADASRLDPAVAASLARNQAVLDQAIAESRAALRQAPTSRVARESLFQALRYKLALLQDTVALANDMRRGDS